MEIGPVVAPAGTIVVICVAEIRLKLAFVPLNLTEVAPVKFVPFIVTLVPGDPLAGEKLLMVGSGCVTVKLSVLVTVPPGVMMVIGPLVAPAGTVVVI